MSDTTYVSTGDTIRLTEEPSMQLSLAAMMTGLDPGILGQEFEVVGTWDTLLENPKYRQQAETRAVDAGYGSLDEALEEHPVQEGLVYIDPDGHGPFGVLPQDYTVVSHADAETANA